MNCGPNLLLLPKYEVDVLCKCTLWNTHQFTFEWDWRLQIWFITRLNLCPRHLSNYLMQSLAPVVKVAFIFAHDQPTWMNIQLLKFQFIHLHTPLWVVLRAHLKKRIGEQDECENSASKSRLLYMAMSKFSIQELFSKLRKTPKNASSIVVRFDSKIKLHIELVLREREKSTSKFGSTCQFAT